MALAVGGMLAASLLWGEGAVEIAGTSSCPSPALVEVALGHLLPGQQAESAVVTIDDGGLDRLELGLTRGRGAETSRRTLTVSRDCVARATAVAVVIATWLDEGSERPLDAPPLPPPRPGPVQHSRSRALPPEAARWWAGVAFLAGGDAEGLSAGLAVEAGGGGRTHGVVAGVAQTLTRERAVGDGRARWATLIAHLAYHRSMPPGMAPTIQVGPALAVVRVQGIGFDEQRQARTVHPGVLMNARWARRTGGVTGWFEVRVHGWPVVPAWQARRNGVVVAETKQASLDAYIALGAAWSP